VPDEPSEPFRTLHDADKLVMFTPKEYPYYNACEGFDWNRLIDLICSKKGQELARSWLEQRKREK